MSLSKKDSTLNINRNKQNLVVITDFDGTITNKDSIKFLLENFAKQGWTETQQKIDEGTINEIEGLSKLLNYLNITWDKALEEILANIKVDEYLFDLLIFLKKKQIPILLVSSGLQEIIEHVLGNKLDSFDAIYANQLFISGNQYVVSNPYQEQSENFENTKEAIISNTNDLGMTTIYLGDGYSDLAASLRANTVFARKDLKTCLETKNREFIELTNFQIVLDYIKNIVNED